MRILSVSLSEIFTFRQVQKPTGIRARTAEVRRVLSRCLRPKLYQ